MQEKKVRLLLIEDNKFDQMAFQRMVTEKDLPYDHTIASSKADAEQKLDNGRFDVIVTDYYLGDGTLFDIMDRMSDLPIIVTTAVGAEEIAIKAMKEGAYDYLIKDVERNYLKVLPVTVRNALQHKRAEEKSRMLSHAIMCIHDSVYITDINDTIVFVNKAFCKNYGYGEDEILGKPSNVLWKDNSVNRRDMKEIMSQIDETGWKSQLVHQRKDGTTFEVLLSRSIIRDAKGNEVAVVGVAHKIGA